MVMILGSVMFSTCSPSSNGNIYSHVLPAHHAPSLYCSLLFMGVSLLHLLAQSIALLCQDLQQLPLLVVTSLQLEDEFLPIFMCHISSVYDSSSFRNREEKECSNQGSNNHQNATPCAR